MGIGISIYGNFGFFGVTVAAREMLWHTANPRNGKGRIQPFPSDLLLNIPHLNNTEENFTVRTWWFKWWDLWIPPKFLVAVFLHKINITITIPCAPVLLSGGHLKKIWQFSWHSYVSLAQFTKFFSFSNDSLIASLNGCSVRISQW